MRGVGSDYKAKGGSFPENMSVKNTFGRIDILLSLHVLASLYVENYIFVAFDVFTFGRDAYQHITYLTWYIKC